MILVLVCNRYDEKVVRAVEKVVRDVLAAKAKLDRATVVRAAAAMRRVNMAGLPWLWKKNHSLPMTRP